jgi:hypothetical protein
MWPGLVVAHLGDDDLAEVSDLSSAQAKGNEGYEVAEELD